MTTGLVIVGRGDVGRIVRAPAPGMAKLMVSGPGEELACWIACRSVRRESRTVKVSWENVVWARSGSPSPLKSAAATRAPPAPGAPAAGIVVAGWNVPSPLPIRRLVSPLVEFPV